MKEIVSHSLTETESIAGLVAGKLSGGEVIAFTGGMGAGKTTFTNGIMNALGAENAVSSPTFTLMNEYDGRLKVYHFDMYRITSWEDLYSTGFFDYISGDGVLIIEWSENVESAIPNDAIRIDLSLGATENERIIRISGIDL